MKIIEWLNNPRSSVNGIAIIEVEENEVADIEKMLILVDGDSVGHFGLSAYLVATESSGNYKINKYKNGINYIDGQFGYPCASEMKKTKRYYKVFVDRD